MKYNLLGMDPMFTQIQHIHRINDISDYTMAELVPWLYWFDSAIQELVLHKLYNEPELWNLLLELYDIPLGRNPIHCSVVSLIRMILMKHPTTTCNGLSETENELINWVATSVNFDMRKWSTDTLSCWFNVYTSRVSQDVLPTDMVYNGWTVEKFLEIEHASFELSSVINFIMYDRETNIMLLKNHLPNFGEIICAVMKNDIHHQIIPVGLIKTFGSVDIELFDLFEYPPSTAFELMKYDNELFEKVLLHPVGFLKLLYGSKENTTELTQTPSRRTLVSNAVIQLAETSPSSFYYEIENCVYPQIDEPIKLVKSVFEELALTDLKRSLGLVANYNYMFINYNKSELAITLDV